jgi:hypothetical protein
MDHKHTPEEEREIREAALDETLAESFPASDPSSTLPNPDDDDLQRDQGNVVVEEQPRRDGSAAVRHSMD